MRRTVLRVAFLGLAVMLLVLLWWSVSFAFTSPLEDADALFAASGVKSAAAHAESRRREGERAAEASMRMGQFRVYEFGLPGIDYKDYLELLRTRYSVTVENTGCMRVADRSDWEDGFTEATKKHLLSSYGRDVFEECAQEARRRVAARASRE